MEFNFTDDVIAKVCRGDKKFKKEVIKMAEYINENIYPNDKQMQLNTTINDATDLFWLIDCVEEVFTFNILGLCGCGCPDASRRDIRNYLRIVNLKRKDFSTFDDYYKIYIARMKEYFNVESVYDNSLLQFMAYILDNKGFTEHGSSIGGAWITEKGKQYLSVLEILDLDSDEDGDEE